ncbi:MAG: hypothetical protein HY096_08755 [Nitrospinae bacterium]|nr:hypothetical protein [Nitrospinota bacterium]
MKNIIIEWAPFTVANGVDDATLIATSEALQNQFLSKQRGFIKRELLKGKDNQWVDVVYWNSKEDAEQAVKNAGDNPVCHRYFQLMVAADHGDPGAGVTHFEQIKVWE